MIVADDAVDIADASDHVIVFLMIPNIFEQPARPLLNLLVVFRGEIDNVAFGSVIYDADNLIAGLISIALRSARDRVISAEMMVGLVSCRNATHVAPFFILALAFDEPDLL